MKKAHVLVDELDIEYTDRGTGPLLLFLHGWGTDAPSFNVFIEQFGNNRCVALSFPGFGGSERPRASWGVLEYAEFVRNFLAKLNIKPDSIVAHSFGGRVAIKGIGAGLLHPRKLVLIASAGVAQKSARARIFGSVGKIAKIFTAIPPFSLLRKSLRRLAGSRDYLNAGPMREIFLKVINENLEADAEKIKTPTLLLWGENDTETTLAEANTLHDRIRGSRLEVIQNADHFVFQEQPSVVAEKIKNFL